MFNRRQIVSQIKSRKNRAFRRGALISALLTMAAAMPAHAATYTWDPGMTPVTPSGGLGDWDLATTSNWSDGVMDNQWTDSSLAGTDLAVFGGLADSVSLNTNLSAVGLQFVTTGYTLSSFGTLTLGASGIDASTLSTGATTVGVGLNLAAAQTWNVGGGATLVVSGSVNGTGFDINLPGAGTVTLSGFNFYTGNTTISAGQLNINSSFALGSGTLNVNGPVILDNTSGGDATLSFNNPVNLNSNFTFGGTNNLNLGAGVVTMSASRIITANGTATLTFGGEIDGAGFGITKNGTGGLGLAGANTYDGGTTLNGGKLNINHPQALGTGVFIINGGGIDNSTFGDVTLSTNNPMNWNADFAFGGTANLNLGTGAVTLSANRIVTTNGFANLTVGGPIGGVGFSLNKDGVGTLTLAAANTYDGGTTLTAGKMNINNAGALGGGTFNILGGTIDNGTFSGITISGNNPQIWSGDFSYGGTGDLNMGTGAITLTGSRVLTTNGTAVLTIAGAISGPGFSLTKGGFGTLTLAGSNTFDGGLTVNSGALNINSAAALGTGAFVLAGGTLDNTSGGSISLTANNPVTFGGNVTFTGSSSLDMGTGAVTLLSTSVITVSSNTLTIGGAIGASGFGLTKAGGGTLVLGGANAYTGATSITGGQVNLTSGGKLGTGNLALTAAGVILDLGGTSASSVGAVTVTNAGTIQNGTLTGTSFAVSNGSGVATLSANLIAAGALTKNGGGTLVLSGDNSSLAGGVTMSGGMLLINSATALGTGTFTLSSGSIDNTSGSAVTISTNNVITLPIGTITFGGSNDLNFGTGAVSPGTSRTYSINGGPGRTLTFGVLSNTATGDRTATVNGVGNTLVLGGLNIQLSTDTSARNYAFAGTGNVIITGTVADGSPLAGSISFTGAGTYTLAGSNTFTGNITVGTGSISSTINPLLYVGTGGFGVAGSGQIIIRNGNNTNATIVYTGTGETVSKSINESLSSGGAAVQGANFTFDQSGTGVLKFSAWTKTATGLHTLTLQGSTAGSGEISAAITQTNPFSIVKDGTGLWTLSGANAYTGSTTLKNGILSVATINNGGVAGNLGTATNAAANLVFSGGTLRYTGASGSTDRSFTITDGSSGTMDISTAATSYTMSGSAAASTGSFAKAGSGTLTLTGTQSYSGATGILAGTLILGGSGSMNASSGVNVNNGARFVDNSGTLLTPTVNVVNGTLDGTGSLSAAIIGVGSKLNHGNGTASPLNISSLTFSGAATTNFLVNTASPLTPLIVTSSLTTTGASTVALNVDNASHIWGNGTFDLFQYSSLGGTGFPGFVKGTITGLVAARQTATIVNAAPYIQLVINGDTPKWTGLDNGNWQVGSTGPNHNWQLVNALTPTDYVVGDVVLFDDSATGTPNVTINAGNIMPTSVSFNNSAVSYSISGAFGITGGFIAKNGSGTVTLATNNSYAGGTSLNAGKLNLNSNTAVGTGPLLIKATGGPVALDNTSGVAVTLTNNNPITVGADFTYGGTNDLNLGTGAITYAATRTITTNGTGTLTMGGAFTGVGLGLNKDGTGTLVLAGNSTYTGNTNIALGALVVTGAINSGNTANIGVINIGTLGGGNAGLVIAGGNVRATKNTAPSVQVGLTAGTSGYLNISSGSLTATSEVRVGSGAGVYAALNMTGGTLTSGAWLTVGYNNDTAVVNQTGGTITVNTNPLSITGNLLTGPAAGNDSLNVGGTGILNANAGIYAGENANSGLSAMNVYGNAVVTAATATGVTIGRNDFSNGQVNLLGGTLVTPVVKGGSVSGTSNFSFNGGVLKASSSNTTFLTGLTGSALVFSGGATLDSGGFNIGIAQPLIAPTGSGVSGIAVGGGGAGYIGAPAVVLTGGTGTGAQAIANITNGVVTSFTVTNPGIGYTPGDVLTAALTGGGYTSVASAGTVTLTGNVSGGLTKVGAGTLTINGVDTFTGATSVTGGTLLISSPGSINTSSGITASGGGKFAVASGAAAITPVVTVNSGGIIGGTGVINTATVNAGGIVTNGLGTGAALNVGTLVLNAGSNLSLVTTSAAPSLAVGVLTTNGGSNSVTVNASQAYWLAGTYDLVSYSSLSGAGLSAFMMGNIAGLTSRQSAVATLLLDGNNLALSVVGAGPTWTGLVNNNWTTATIGGAGNWSIGGGPTEFLPTDAVLFDDTAASGNVNVADVTVNPSTVTVNNGTLAYNISGGSIGSGNLVKAGTGTLTLSSANSYAGGTTLNSGQIILGNAGALGSGALVVNGGKLDSAVGGTVTLANPVSLNGSLSYIGTNPIAFSGTMTASGALAGINIPGGKQVLVANIASTGGFTFTQDGAGTLTLTGATPSALGGTLAVNAGVFQLNAQSLTVGGLSGAGTIEDGSGTARTLTVAPATNTTFSGLIRNGSGGVLSFSTGAGAGILTLAGTNTYTGTNTIVSGSTVNVAADNALGTGVITLNSGNPLLQLSGGHIISNALLFNGRNSTSVGIENVNGNNTFGGALSLNINGNSYSIQSDAGTLTLSAPLVMGNSGNASGARILNLSGTGDGLITGVLNNAVSNTVLSVVKAGAGTWTLANAANTYTGGVTINGGTLASNGFSLPAVPAGGANVTVNLGGVYALMNTAAMVHASAISITDSTYNAYISYGTGGKLSLGNNDMILRNDSLLVSEATLNASLAAPQMVGGVWVTSNLLNGATYTALTGLHTFDTASFNAADLLLRYGYAGDMNFSGKIDIDDYLAIDAGFVEGLSPTNAHGDFNHDGSINAADYALIDFNYLHQVGTLADGEISLHTAQFGSAYISAFNALSTSAVPEPSSLLLLGVSAASLLARRRRQ